MGSASRQALAAAEQTLTATKGVTLATGEQLLSAGRAIEGSAQLRGLLADPSLESAEKAGLISTIFGSLDATATKLRLGIVEARWSDAGELLDGIEQIGIRAIADASGSGAAIESELFEFSRAVSSNSDLELALADKLGDPAAKAALIDTLLAKKASPAATAIVRHLVQSPRGRRIDRGGCRRSPGGDRHDRGAAFGRPAEATQRGSRRALRPRAPPQHRHRPDRDRRAACAARR
jgi:F-type H+-transporting ATPase subunit delta